ncbi:MAG TPA: hypothetical protein DHV48_15870 [Prolixibacteraceae bacterium]|nr:hypothetical protein [Prolixibacteraceae bacterium]
MKRIFLLQVIMVLMVVIGYGVQPLRKPFLQITVDGKPSKSGDILTVKPGQKFLIKVDIEGGRRDFCKFPDTYADIAGTAQILTRGKDGISYQINGQNAVWKLLNEDIRFAADEFLQIKSTASQSAEITVSSLHFSQSYLKITGKTSWQFSQGGQLISEENTAEGTLYFKVEGESDVWFTSKNIEATGIANEQVKEKLKATQLMCDSIERSFFRLNFSAVQQSIRDLQNSVNVLKSTIDDVKTGNPSYKTAIVFKGLPSDDPFLDITVFSAIKPGWTTLETLVNNSKQQLAALPAQPTPQNNDQLIQIITGYLNWQNSLPENTFSEFSRYIPELVSENILMPVNIRRVAEVKSVANYAQTISDLNTFLDQRILQIPEEIQKINAANTRLQTVKLFDGMLRGYFSSINWAEWKSTRGF